MEQDWSETSSSPQGPQPQQELTWLFGPEDFEERVVKDHVNLCCVMVTSTLCRHSGIRKLRYPKPPPPPQQHGNSLDGDEENEAEEEDFEDEEEEEEEDDFEDGDGEGPVPRRSHFFRDVKAKLVETDQFLSQRRHVRFFHVCACTEEQTNIAPLLQNDPTLALYGRMPSEFDIKEMHRTAHKQLTDLLQQLEVTSTPCMLFFLKGQPLRYSMMLDPAPENRVSVRGAKDNIVARGSNYVKWRRVLINATTVRNEAMKEYDEEVREQARQAKREQRKRERAERRRLRALEAAEDEEDEEDDDGGY